MGLGPWEIILVILGIIILFGGKKIPELARGLSKGLHEFKKTTKEIQDEVDTVTDDVKKSVDDTKESPSWSSKKFIW